MNKIFALRSVPCVSSFSKSNGVFTNYGIITIDETQDSTRVLIEDDDRRGLLGYYKDRGLIMNIYTHVRRRAR